MAVRAQVAGLPSFTAGEGSLPLGHHTNRTPTAWMITLPIPVPSSLLGVGQFSQALLGDPRGFGRCYGRLLRIKMDSALNLVYDEWPNFLGNRPMVEALSIGPSAPSGIVSGAGERLAFRAEAVCAGVISLPETALAKGRAFASVSTASPQNS